MTWKEVFPTPVLSAIDSQMRHKDQPAVGKPQPQQQRTLEHFKSSQNSDERRALPQPGAYARVHEPKGRATPQTPYSLPAPAVPVCSSVALPMAVVQSRDELVTHPGLPTVPALPPQAPFPGTQPSSLGQQIPVAAANLPPASKFGSMTPFTWMGSGGFRPAVAVVSGSQHSGHLLQSNKLTVANFNGPVDSFPRTAASLLSLYPGVAHAVQLNMAQGPKVPNQVGQLQPTMQQVCPQGYFPATQSVFPSHTNAALPHAHPPPYAQGSASALQPVPHPADGSGVQMPAPQLPSQQGSDGSACVNNGLDVQAIFSLLENLAEEKEKQQKESAVSVVDAVALTPEVLKVLGKGDRQGAVLSGESEVVICKFGTLWLRWGWCLPMLRVASGREHVSAIAVPTCFLAVQSIGTHRFLG